MRSLLVGGEAMGWVRPRPDPIPVDNLVFYALNIGPVAILYPIREQPLYVKAGLGVALVGLSVDPLVGFPVPSDHQGIGATVEVGVDLLDVAGLTLNPSVSWGGQSFGSQSGNLRRIGSNTFLLITLGIRVR